MYRLFTVAAGAAGAALATLVGTTPVSAENWPENPISVIVPFSAGGGTDTVARAVWSAPIEWSSLNVSAWSVVGLSGRCFWALAAGIPKHCEA